MTHTNESPVSTEAAVESQPAACSSGCKHGRSGLLRAVLYTPIVLILGALGAVAMFPDLAEYASPVIGQSKSCNCPLKAMCAAMGFGESGSSQAAAEASTSSAPCCRNSGMSSMSMGGCQGNSACSSESGACPSASASVSAEEVPTGEVTAVDEAPADAFAVLNRVESESTSN